MQRLPPGDRDVTDSYTEVSSQGYFSRLGGSLVGALFGLLLLVAGVVLLYWNEGRAVEAAVALERGAKLVVEAPLDAVDPAQNGKLVHVAGQAHATAPPADPMFEVGAGGFLRLQRKAEMFQWKEEEHKTSHEQLGGTKVTETTYTYVPQWSENPINSSTFKHPEGHVNPDMGVRSQVFNGAEVRLGAYRLGAGVLEKFTQFVPVPFKEGAALPEGYRHEGQQLFRGTGSSGAPRVGDVRIAFYGIPEQTVSIAAGLAGDTLDTYRDAGNGYAIAIAEPGAAPAAALFKGAEQSESQLTWILRGVGTLVIFVGLLLVAGPVSMLLAFLPFLEGIAQVGSFLIALTVSLPIALVTIAVAWIAHRPVVGAALLAAAVAIFVLLRKSHPKPAPQELAASMR